MAEHPDQRTLVLPYLVAGRDLANAMIDPLEPVMGTRFVVDGRALATGSVSFASQLVVRVLDQGQAAALVLRGAPRDFAGHVRGAADRLAVSDRLQVEQPAVATAS